MNNSEKVREFMEVFGQEVKPYPIIPSGKVQALRHSLIEEELREFADAIEKGDLVEIADALTDILYVTYGAMHAFGLPADALFQEVHRSNMSKLENGVPIYRHDGKVMKGKDYTPPDLKSIVDAHRSALAEIQGDVA